MDTIENIGKQPILPIHIETYTGIYITAEKG